MDTYLPKNIVGKAVVYGFIAAVVGLFDAVTLASLGAANE